MKKCGIITNGLRKLTFVSLCNAAVATGTEVEPDGLQEQFEEVAAVTLEPGMHYIPLSKDRC